MSPEMEMLAKAVDDSAADIAFGVIVLGIFGSLMLVVMFSALALRAAWRWLTRHTWRDVIVSVERKAFRTR